MKNLIQIFSAALITVFMASCSGGGQTLPEVKLIPVGIGNDYEYIDQEGKIVINPQFSEATLFRNGLALVKSNGNDPKWGYITEDGKFAIMPNYKKASIFSDDLAWVIAGNGVRNAINNKGEIKITLNNVYSVKIFKEGLAAYSESDKGREKWGFVDKNGKIKINPQFTATGNFNNGKCAVANQDGKWGYIDAEGKIIINFQFDGAQEFVNKKAVVFLGGKCGVIDVTGKYIINPQFSAMTADGNMFLILRDGKYGWCDNEGKIIINPQFDVALPFLNNNLASVKSGKSFGYIDKEGKILINPQFDEAYPFIGSLALVKSGGKIGFIDKDGKYVINPQFDKVSRDFVTSLIGNSEYEELGRTQEEQYEQARILDSLAQDSIAKVEEAAKAAEMARQDSLNKAAGW